MRVLKVEPHLSREELYHRYRNEPHPVARSYFHALWLVAQGMQGKEVAKHMGYCDSWVYGIVRRYNKEGPDAMRDHRQESTGRPPLASPEIMKELDHLLQTPAPDGGLWTSPKVAQWLAQRLGVEHVHPARGWEILRTLGYRSYVPRPQHVKTSPEVQEEWEKNCPSRLRM
jgi:transposase